MGTEIEVRPATEADLAVLMAFDHGSTSERVWQLDLHREPRDLRVAATFREIRLPRPVVLRYPRDPVGLTEIWQRKPVMYVAATGIQPIGYAVAVEAPAEPRWRVRWCAHEPLF